MKKTDMVNGVMVLGGEVFQRHLEINNNLIAKKNAQNKRYKKRMNREHEIIATVNKTCGMCGKDIVPVDTGHSVIYECKNKDCVVSPLYKS